MIDKIVFIPFILILLFSCSKENIICLDIQDIEKSKCYFYISEVEENCENILTFNCRDQTIKGKLKFDGVTFRIKFKQDEKYVEFFSLRNSINTIKHFDSFYSCSHLRDNYKYTLEGKIERNNDENIMNIKIDSLLKNSTGYLAYNFFLSDKHGIIGNYFTSDLYERVILTANGDILKDVIDYEQTEFANLHY